MKSGLLLQDDICSAKLVDIPHNAYSQWCLTSRGVTKPAVVEPEKALKVWPLIGFGWVSAGV